MNVLILKRATVLAALLGIVVAAVGLVPFFIIYVVLFLSFFASPAVFIFMKKKKLIGVLDVQQSAFLGGAIGLACSVGFFAVFVPAVWLIHAIFKSYYSYGIEYFIQFQALWLFIIILAMLAGILALTNAVSAMATNYIYTQIEKVPDEAKNPIDIKIDGGV